MSAGAPSRHLRRAEGSRGGRAGSVASVPNPLKYAAVERERRYLVADVPEGVVEVRQIVDYYLEGTRFRLRQITGSDGTVTRKLGHNVRLTSGPSEVATSVYLDEREWEILRALPSRTLRKTRNIIERDGIRLAVDELPDGTLLAEIDDGDIAPVLSRTGFESSETSRPKSSGPEQSWRPEADRRFLRHPFSCILEPTDVSSR